jgi:hypothetical protein
VAVSFIGGGNQSTWRKPLTCRKSLTNFIALCYIIGSWQLIFTLYKPQPGYAKLIQGIVDKICIIDALPLSNQDLIIRLY